MSLKLTHSRERDGITIWTASGPKKFGHALDASERSSDPDKKASFTKAMTQAKEFEESFISNLESQLGRPPTQLELARAGSSIVRDQHGRATGQSWKPVRTADEQIRQRQRNTLQREAEAAAKRLEDRQFAKMSRDERLAKMMGDIEERHQQDDDAAEKLRQHQESQYYREQMARLQALSIKAESGDEKAAIAKAQVAVSDPDLPQEAAVELIDQAYQLHQQRFSERAGEIESEIVLAQQKREEIGKPLFTVKGENLSDQLANLKSQMVDAKFPENLTSMVDRAVESDSESFQRATLEGFTTVE